MRRAHWAGPLPCPEWASPLPCPEWANPLPCPESAGSMACPAQAPRRIDASSGSISGSASAARTSPGRRRPRSARSRPTSRPCLLDRGERQPHRVGAAPGVLRAARTATGRPAERDQVEAAVEHRAEDDVAAVGEVVQRAARRARPARAAGPARRSGAGPPRRAKTRPTASAKRSETPLAASAGTGSAPRRPSGPQHARVARVACGLVGDVHAAGRDRRPPSRRPADQQPLQGSMALGPPGRAAARRRPAPDPGSPHDQEHRGGWRRMRPTAELSRARSGTWSRRAAGALRRPARRPRPSSTSANTAGLAPISSISVATGVGSPGIDLVGVVGDEADQRERQLELAAQHGLGPAGLADGDDAAGRQLGDLGRGVEAGPVDVAVGAAVARRMAGLRRRRPAAPRARPRRTGRRGGSSGRARGRRAR